MIVFYEHHHRSSRKFVSNYDSHQWSFVQRIVYSLHRKFLIWLSTRIQRVAWNKENWRRQLHFYPEPRYLYSSTFFRAMFPLNSKKLYRYLLFTFRMTFFKLFSYPVSGNAKVWNFSLSFLSQFTHSTIIFTNLASHVPEQRRLISDETAKQEKIMFQIKTTGNGLTT